MGGEAIVVTRHIWKVTTFVLAVLFIGQWNVITSLNDEIDMLRGRRR